MMTLSEAAFALGVAHRGENPLFTAVGTDSRNIQAGQLFIALRGQRFDAHAYLACARDAGAVAAMVDEQGAALAPLGLPLIVVNNTHQGLTQLAYAWRSRFTGPLVALTGSSGKTTVKEMLAAILREVYGEHVLATRGNLNNDIGVPLTLLALRAHHRCAVIEMGMNHAGEIRALTLLARPDVALVNNAGRAHIEFLGSLEAIARAKGEIFEGLTAQGVAVINADDGYALLWKKIINKIKYLQFGLDQPSEVTARHELRALNSTLHLSTPVGAITATLNAPGLHNVRNALAASAAAIALHVPLSAIAAGLVKYTGVKGRLQRKSLPGGVTLIDDTYNANPESIGAAIDVLARAGEPRMLVLGDMGELGAHAAACHTEVGAHAREAGIETLYALGEMSAHAVAAFGANARHFADADALINQLRTVLSPGVAGTAVLVKGSRFMKMERVVDALAREAQACC